MQMERILKTTDLCIFHYFFKMRTRQLEHEEAQLILKEQMSAGQR